MLISLNSYILGESGIILKRLNENCRRRYSYYILYHYLKYVKNRQKLKNNLIAKQTHKSGSQPCD